MNVESEGISSWKKILISQVFKWQAASVAFLFEQIINIFKEARL
ncbi:hypothetical protein HMPREF9398_0365 [Streptococcus sanguinis VMC66]|jgi:hypothetical protein|nr:hypothetical protein HMPREF9398_0365 [Streptococcus sanguinis VMC66]